MSARVQAILSSRVDGEITKETCIQKNPLLIQPSATYAENYWKFQTHKEVIRVE